jgi:Na+/proline symporter
MTSSHRQGRKQKWRLEIIKQAEAAVAAAVAATPASAYLLLAMAVFSYRRLGPSKPKDVDYHVICWRQFATAVFSSLHYCFRQ